MNALRVAFVIPILAAASVSRLAAQAADGQAIYKEECKSCHGINGVPPERAVRQYSKIKSLGEGGFVSALAEDSIATLVKKGIDKDMKSFAAKLSDVEIKAVAKYIKELAVKKKAGG